MAESRDERPSFDEASALPSFPDDEGPFGEFCNSRVLPFVLLPPSATTRRKLRNKCRRLGDAHQTS
jgi:hypothetical protein